MQNTTTTPQKIEHLDLQTYWDTLILKIQLASKILASKKAILIVDNQIDVYNMSIDELGDRCANILVDVVENQQQEAAIMHQVKALIH